MSYSSVPTVVVSYSHEGGDPAWMGLVTQLVTGLRANGVDVAFDRDFADRETDWAVFGPAAIREREFVVCVASPGSREAFDSEFVGGPGYGIWEEARELHARIGRSGPRGVVWVLLGERSDRDIPDRYRSSNRPMRVVDGDVTGLVRWIEANRTGAGRVESQAGWRPQTYRVSPLMPRRNDFFVGRANELARLADHHAKGASVTSVVTESVVGNGGVGKSELALEYGYQCLDQQRVDWVGWLLADSQETFLQQLGGLGDWLGVPRVADESPENRARRVCDRLGEELHEWVLIVDNAEPEVTGLEMLPQLGRGQIVITSRSRKVAERLRAVPVDLAVLDPADALEFLRERTVGVADAALAGVAEGVGFLPLGLDIAAALLRDGESASTVLDQLPGEPGTDREVTIAALWDATLGRLSPEAVRLLGLVCACAPDRVPIWALSSAELEPPFPLHAAARRELVSWSLIDVAPDDLVGDGGPVASVHRLLRGVINRPARVGSSSPSAAARPGVCGAADAVAMLGAAFTGDATQPDSWRLAAALEPHILAVFDSMEHECVSDRPAMWLRWLVDRTATARQYSGDIRNAPPLFQRSLKYAVRRLGENHLDTLTARLNLAASLYALGDVAGAVELERQVLAERINSLGEQHPDTLTARNSLALSLLALGDAAGAVELERQVLAERINILGEHHPDTVTARLHLALSLLALGDAAGAVELERQVLADRINSVGEQHPDTLAARLHLADSLFALGDAAGAVELERQVLADRINILGEHHPDTLTARNNLAHSLRALGDTVGAVELERQVLADRINILGEHHPDTLSARNNLAASLYALGDAAGAAELQRQVLTDSINTLGNQHPNTIIARGNFAFSLGELGDAAGAAELQRQVLTDSIDTLGELHPNTLQACGNLALSLWELGDRDEAIEKMQGAVDGMAAILPDHPDTAKFQQILAEWQDQLEPG